jgi:manganese transport protein
VPPPPSDLATSAPVRVAAAPGPGRAWSHGLRRLLSLLGPAWLVAVGYIDPGNWATDLAAGAGHGYALLWVVAAASLAAMALQVLAARLGLATGADLARLTADMCPPWARWPMWLLAEAAICACDLAELIGAAIALKLLFGLPIALGVALTGLDVLLILRLGRTGSTGRLIAGLFAGVAAAFVIELVLVRPDWAAAASGLLPRPASLAPNGALYLAAGIVGATVMPHNLYLHSALTAGRKGGRDLQGTTRFLGRDAFAALALAMLVNLAIVILASAAFHRLGRGAVGIEDAYGLLTPLLGPAAAALFALALLAAGESASLSATLAGQAVMEGFVRIRLAPGARRLLTRGLALGPALVAVLLWGQDGLSRLLVQSQVVLSLQLPFAMIPMLWLAGDRKRMGALATPRWLLAVGWAAAALIVTMNLALLAGA